MSAMRLCKAVKEELEAKAEVNPNKKAKKRSRLLRYRIIIMMTKPILWLSLQMLLLFGHKSNTVRTRKKDLPPIQNMIRQPYTSLMMHGTISLRP